MTINILKEIDEKILKTVKVCVMCLLTFLPRFKYLSLLRDMVMAGGQWTFLFPRLVLCYPLVHLSLMTHVPIREAHT